MRCAYTLPVLLALAACAAPEIDDWPPAAPTVDAATVGKYVQRYSSDFQAPAYTQDDIDALVILNKRRFREVDEEDDIARLRRDLRDIRAASDANDDDVTVGPDRSRTEKYAIERRIDRNYETMHDRRIQRKRYGL